MDGAADTDYTISYSPGTLTVTPAVLTVSADDKSMVYGSVVPVLTASYSGFVNGDGIASLTTLATIRTTATDSSHVSGGPYAITTSEASDPDYTMDFVTGSLTIARRH